MKRFLLLALACLGSVAFAFDIDSALENISAAANDVTDVNFLLTGKLYDSDGTTIVVELDMMLIPSEELINVFIYQPDALADNMIILDNDTIASYTFLTHQVTLFDASDPRAFGDIIPAAQDSKRTISISFDINQLFADFGVELISGTDEDPFVTVLFYSSDPADLIQEVWTTVETATWLPVALTIYGADDYLFGELTLTDVVLNQGLTAEELRELPFDVEIIDRRAKQ